MQELDETVRDFLVESFENIDQLDRELLLLESTPNDLDAVNKIFRIVHTIKGTCGFFDFRKLERVSHVGENLLDSLRSGRFAVNRNIITGLLRLSDTLRELLVHIEQSGCEGIGDYSPLIALLDSLNEGPCDVEIGAVGASGIAPLDSGDDSTRAELERAFVAAQAEHAAASGCGSCFSPPVIPGECAEVKKAELSDSSLRVDVGILDKLMNLVGELVLARNQILQFTKRQNDSDFVSTSQRLNLITSELQEGIMRTRMQPISTVWNKLPRIVRDISHACGKQVRLEMHGKKTELDKTIIEAIKDPLTHVIRNSVDHGIESVEARVAAGKPPEGLLLMRAFHEGGQVVIEIADDGAGLNTERIRDKAIEKGLVSRDKAGQMSEGEIQRLIFLPGFSTAEKITNISGRGVGMDVVRSNIERIGGAVDVGSRSGFGSKFTIKIPLTLAIIPGLIVTTNGNRYAIPQVNLLELVRLEGEQVEKSIERIHGADFYRLRGKILPLVHLDTQLGLSPKDDGASGSKSTIVSLIVVRADNHQFGLVVDAIHDTEEIVVKPLGPLLKGIPAFAGATIMGDGQVALILDIVGLARQAQIAKKEAVLRVQEKMAHATAKDIERRKMFVFELAQGRRAAVPLEEVYRLEEFAAETLECAGDLLVVQYRDGILPLVDLRNFFGAGESRAGTLVKAFVHHDGQRLVGFVVERIVDIVDQAVKVESPYRKAGLIGSAVIQNKVTDMLCLRSIMRLMSLDATGDHEEAVA